MSVTTDGRKLDVSKQEAPRCSINESLVFLPTLDVCINVNFYRYFYVLNDGLFSSKYK